MIDFISDVCLSFIILMPVHLWPSASMLKELNDDPVMFYIKQHEAHVLARISLFKQKFSIRIFCFIL